MGISKVHKAPWPLDIGVGDMGALVEELRALSQRQTGTGTTT